MEGGGQTPDFKMYRNNFRTNVGRSYSEAVAVNQEVWVSGKPSVTIAENNMASCDYFAAFLRGPNFSNMT